MTTVTRTYDKEGKKPETETENSLGEQTIKKETTTSLSKDISNKTDNYTTENKDNLIESEILETGILKNTSKIGQFKDDRKYILSNDVDKLQDNLLKIVENESKDDDYSVNVMSSKNNQKKK